MYHVVVLLQKTHSRWLRENVFVNPVPMALTEEGRSGSDYVGVGMSVAYYVQSEVGSKWQG